jgi:hypothetical protein
MTATYRLQTGCVKREYDIIFNFSWNKVIGQMLSTMASLSGCADGTNGVEARGLACHE